MNTIFNSQYSRFLCGSVLCASINNVILIVGDYFGIGYILLTFIFYLASGTFGYLFHSRITFGNEMTLHGYLCFMAGICLGLPVSLAILAMLSMWFALPMWIAAPTMTVLMVAYHYLIARLAITRRLAAPITYDSGTRTGPIMP